jgi:hypothetical protein
MATTADLAAAIAETMGADPTDPRIASVGDPWTISAVEEYAYYVLDTVGDRGPAGDAARAAEYHRITKGELDDDDLADARRWANGRTLI